MLPRWYIQVTLLSGYSFFLTIKAFCFMQVEALSISVFTVWAALNTDLCHHHYNHYNRDGC